MKFNIFELGIFSFNSYVYYLTRGFIASTRAFNLITRAFNPPARAFNLATRAFSLLTRGFELVTREFELVTRGSELLTRRFELVTRGFELVTRVLLFHDKTLLQRSEERLSFSPLSVEVVLCSSMWVDRSLYLSPTISLSKISVLFSLNHFTSTTLRNVP